MLPLHQNSDADVQRALEWFVSLLPEGEWESRRNAQLTRLRQSTLAPPTPEGLPQRVFHDDDVIGWYLTLAHAFVSNIQDYEPAQGSRIVPLFKVIGADLDMLRSIEGAEERAIRMLANDRARPDGPLFELITALAYRRDGCGQVRFIPEIRGGARSPDIEVVSPSGQWAVECKRIHASEYTKAERNEFWRLWHNARPLIHSQLVSLFFDLDFRKQVSEVPDNYLLDLARDVTRTGTDVLVDDEFSHGRVSWTNLRPLQEVLEHDVVLNVSQRFFELLTGSYNPYASYTGIYRSRPWEMNNRYIDDIDIASLARWKCSAPEAIQAKARYFLRQISSANEQLENYGRGIIHIGTEVLEGTDVEVARRPRTLQMVRGFNSEATDLHWLYIHYFSPESPPDEAWAFQETVDWFAMKPVPDSAPRTNPQVVVPPNAQAAPHPWE